MHRHEIGHHRHQRNEFLRERKHRAQWGLIQRISGDDHVGLLVSQHAAHGIVQHRLQSAFHQTGGGVGIGGVVTELVHFRYIARDAIVIRLAVAQHTRRAFVVQHVDDLERAFATVRFLQRLGDGVGRAAMAEAGVGGEDEDAFRIGHGLSPRGTRSVLQRFSG